MLEPYEHREDHEDLYKPLIAAGDLLEHLQPRSVHELGRGSGSTSVTPEAILGERRLSRPLHARRSVRVVLVQRLLREECLGQRIEPRPFLAQQNLY